jgi:hypothetical protein
MKSGTLKSRANFRRGYGLSAPLLRVLPIGHAVQFEPNYTARWDNEEWVLVRDQADLGFVARRLISEGGAPPPPPPTTWKIGYHLLDEMDNQAIIGHLERMAALGKPPAGLTIVLSRGKNANLIAEIRRALPKAHLLIRIYGGGDAQNPDTFADGVPDGAAWLERWWPEIAPHADPKFADFTYFQVAANEWGATPGHDKSRLAQLSVFYQQLAFAARRRGIRVTVGDFAVGNGPDDGGPREEEIFPMLATAAAWGMPLNYHMYNGDANTPLSAGMDNAAEHLALRFVRWAARFPALKIIGGEAGAGDWRNSGSAETEIAAIHDLNRLLTDGQPRQYPNISGRLALNPSQVLFFGWWSLGGQPHGQWGKSRYEQMLPAFEQRL